MLQSQTVISTVLRGDFYVDRSVRSAIRALAYVAENNLSLRFYAKKHTLSLSAEYIHDRKRDLYRSSARAVTLM